MAIIRCGTCNVPYLREEIVGNRCGACGAPLKTPAATAKIHARPDAAPPEDPGNLGRAVVLAVLVPALLALGAFLLFRQPAGAPATPASQPLTLTAR